MKSNQTSGKALYTVALWTLCCFAAFSLTACGEKADYVAATRQAGATRIPGTRVSLHVPAGYEPASGFAGVMDINTRCSIMITEMDGSFDDLANSLNDPAALRTQNLVLSDRETYFQGTYPGLLLQLTQNVQGQDVRKWMWLFGDDDRSVMIMGTCLKPLVATEFDRLGEAVRSATWEPKLSLDLTSEVDFYLEDLAGMKLVTSMGQNLTYSSDGAIDKGGATGKPIFIISPSMQPSTSAPMELARKRIRSYPQYKSVSPGSFDEVSIDGLLAYECVGTASHHKTGASLLLYQVMVFEGTSYWLMVGTCLLKDQATQLPAFKQMAASFKRRQETLTSKDGRTSIEVPSNWKLRSGLSDEADIQAGQPMAETYLMVLSELKSEYGEGATFEDICKATRSSFHPPVNPATDIKIGGLHANKVRLTAEVGTNVPVYLHVNVEGPEHFHQIVMWCLEESESTAMPSFERILASFREVR